MLTEKMVFPNIGRSDPNDLARLTLQERARLRMEAGILTARDLLNARGGKKVTDEPEEVQIACRAPAT